MESLYCAAASGGAVPPAGGDTDSDEAECTGPVAPRRGTSTPLRSAGNAAPAAAASAAASAAPAPPRKRARPRRVVVNTCHCRYHVVRQAAQSMGWLIEDDARPDVPEAFAMPSAHRAFLAKLRHYSPDATPQVFWVDVSVLQQRVAKLQSWQRINHFPNMHVVARKTHLFVRLMKHRAAFPQLYDFFPLSWSLRCDATALGDFVRSLRGRPRTFVMKPNGGCQGKGIVLTRNPLKVAQTLPDSDYIVQLYVHRPLLIDGCKFDVRVYVLLLSVLSPQIFVHREGLVRICAAPYEKPHARNLADAQRHLTNYAVNKSSQDFAVDAGGAGGKKRDFDFLQNFITSTQGHAAWIELVRRIDRAVVLTLLSAQHELRQTLESCNLSGAKVDGRVCFELLGFDIMVTQAGHVHVLEVNHSPSLFCDSPLDTRIKHRVVLDVFRMIDPHIIGDLRRASDLGYEKHCAAVAVREKAAAARSLTHFRQAFPCVDEPANYAPCHGTVGAAGDGAPPAVTTPRPESRGGNSSASSSAEDDAEADGGDQPEARQMRPFAAPIGPEYEQLANADYGIVLGGTVANAAAQQLQRLVSPGCRPPSAAGSGQRAVLQRKGSGGAAAVATALLARSRQPAEPPRPDRPVPSPRLKAPCSQRPTSGM